MAARKITSKSKIAVNRWTYLGVFFVAAATMMFEILLLRIFSVTMWYHFAFMAISIALFGMTVGAVIVYLLPSAFNEDKLRHKLSLSALLFAVSIVASFVAYLFIRRFVGAPMLILSIIYLIISVPFIFSGICVTLALTKLPSRVGKLYAADLIGAASGCILLIVVLEITSAPTAILAVGALAAIGAFFFALDLGSKIFLRGAFFVCLIFILIFTANTFGFAKQAPFLRLGQIKGMADWEQLYEKWNSFSRITVSRSTGRLINSGWAMSPTYRADKTINELSLLIDGMAMTPLTGFNGNLAKADFLKYDMVNLAHYLRKDADILVVGPGGGRDILSALVFKQKSVVGVEVNENILEAINQTFGDFTGHLDRYPQVEFVNDEARSYVTRSKKTYDIIQASLIDSFAATGAGAFALTENSLYTVEAWKIFLTHLKPGGILTFSRWYFQGQPGEIYRLTALASQSLKELGVQNPRDHIIITRRMSAPDELSRQPDGVGTILVSKEPFTARDIAIISRVVKQMRFEVVLSPQMAINGDFATLVSKTDTKKFIDGFPIDISAPTDNNPFFFQMMRLKDVLKLKSVNQGILSMNMEAVGVLFVLFVITFIFSLVFIVAPLVIKTSSIATIKILPFLMYFAGIGLGFMLVEVSQMQRLIILLGHPAYSLSVLLFSLLISSGVGSLAVQRINDVELFRTATSRLSLIVISLATFGLLSPYVISYSESTHIITRVILTVAMLLPIGFFMGMAFPFGMRLANLQVPSFAPLLWGVNGASSVFASVLAVVLALNWGITTAFWTGVMFYFITLNSLIWIKKHSLTPSEM